MKVIITTDRLNSLRKGEILEYGKDKPTDIRIETLINNGEAEFVKEEKGEEKKENKIIKKIKTIKKIK